MIDSPHPICTGRDSLMKPLVLTIAGSDCSGGAGIQADPESPFGKQCLCHVGSDLDYCPKHLWSLVSFSPSFFDY